MWTFGILSQGRSSRISKSLAIKHPNLLNVFSNLHKISDNSVRNINLLLEFNTPQPSGLTFVIATKNVRLADVGSKHTSTHSIPKIRSISVMHVPI